jgi:hypothetical protein
MFKQFQFSNVEIELERTFKIETILRDEFKELYEILMPPIGLLQHLTLAETRSF